MPKSHKRITFLEFLKKEAAKSKAKYIDGEAIRLGKIKYKKLYK